MGEEFFIENNGRRYARISSVASLGKSFAGINPQVLRRKTQIGSSVHEAIRKFFSGEESCFPSDEPEQSYFKGFLKWCRTFSLKVHAFETRMFDDELRLTGQFDLIASASFSAIPAVFDFKTAAVEDRGVWEVQGYFYRRLIDSAISRGEEWTRALSGINSDQIFFVRLTPKGDYVLCAYDLNDRVEEKALERYRRFFEEYQDVFQ